MARAARSPTQAPRGDVTARFILDAASKLGIAVGCALDGSELVAPLKVPRETRRRFERKLDEFRADVIDIIQRENEGGQS